MTTNDNTPIPNSPKFAALSIEEQRLILERRTETRLTIHRKSCICEECRGPSPWRYEPDAAKALDQWLNGKKTPAWFAPGTFSIIEGSNQ